MGYKIKGSKEKQNQYLQNRNNYPFDLILTNKTGKDINL